MFERKGIKVLYCIKTNLKEQEDNFQIESNTLFYANFFLHWGNFKFSQRPPPWPDSDVWSSQSSSLLISGFQDFSTPNSFLFLLSFDWCAANTSWKTLQLLSWIFPVLCNVLMILSVVCHVRWHQYKRNILPLKRWTALSLQSDLLCFTYHKTLWIP